MGGRMTRLYRIVKDVVFSDLIFPIYEGYAPSVRNPEATQRAEALAGTR